MLILVFVVVGAWQVSNNENIGITYSKICDANHAHNNFITFGQLPNGDSNWMLNREHFIEHFVYRSIDIILFKNYLDFTS